jgi:hypothetical protein
MVLSKRAIMGKSNLDPYFTQLGKLTNKQIYPHPDQPNNKVRESVLR